MQPDHASQTPAITEPRFQAASQLLQLVREEALVLERLDGNQLLELLPRKEALVRLLEQRMAAPDVLSGQSENEAVRGTLRECLAQIRAENQRNRRFIENSLEYWRDLVGLLVPATYDRTGTEAVPTHHAALCGARINREV